MLEKVGERQRELEQQGFCRPLANEMAHLDAREERARTGKVVIKPSDREWFEDRMGAGCLYHLDFSYEDSTASDWWVLSHDIKGVSGKHRHQGGIALFVLDGRGKTYLDGDWVEWKKGDLILLPIKPGEVEHGHETIEGDARFIAFIHVPMWNAVGSQMVQTEDREDWDPVEN
jgi:hypothetical protein